MKKSKAEPVQIDGTNQDGLFFMTRPYAPGQVMRSVYSFPIVLSLGDKPKTVRSNHMVKTNQE
jgi:hypothetical protein